MLQELGVLTHSSFHIDANYIYSFFTRNIGVEGTNTVQGS